MAKKIILLLLIISAGYFFYNPMILSLADIKDPEPFNLIPGQTFKLKDIPELKNAQNTVVYIVLDHEDRKNMSPKIPKWKVLTSSNSTLVNGLFNCEFKYSGSDVSTVQSMMYIYSNNTLIFESEISLDSGSLGIQNRATGWITPVENNHFISIISQFDRYKLPVLIIK